MPSGASAADVAPSAGAIAEESAHEKAQESPYLVMEARNSLVYTLAGQDAGSPRTNFLVAGRSLLLHLHLPLGWTVRTIDSQFKIIDQGDCPEVLEPRTVFGADYVVKDTFLAPRMLPRTERLSTKAYTPVSDPVQKGQMVLSGATETRARSRQEGSDCGGAGQGFRSMSFSLALPNRELRLMTPCKGRRPLGSERYHVDRMAFGQFLLVLEHAVTDGLAPQDRIVFVRSPLIQFFFRMDSCSLEGNKGAATWKVCLPQSKAPIGDVHEAITRAVNRAFSMLNSETPLVGDMGDPSESTLECVFERERDGEQEEEARDNEQEDDSDTDSTSDSERESRLEKRRLFPSGPRSRRMPKWREAYVINDSALRNITALSGKGVASASVVGSATPTTTGKTRNNETAAPKKSPPATTGREFSDAKGETSKVAAATAVVPPTPEVAAPEVAAPTPTAEKTPLTPHKEAKELEKELVDLTDILLLRLRLLAYPEVLCPYQNCTVVAIRLDEDCGSHFSWHTARGDLLLYHLLDGKCAQPAPKLPVPAAATPARNTPKPLPSESSLKKIAWEDEPMTYLESLNDPQRSFRLWYNHVLCYDITDDRVAEDCAAVPADAFGMKVCPASRCRKVIPASRLEEHYRAHFVLVTIHRHRSKTKAEVVPQAATPAPVEVPPAPAEASIAYLPRTANGRFAKRSKDSSSATPRKRPKRPKEKNKKPARRVGRPPGPRPLVIEPAASFTPARLPRLEPGKATAYGSANVLRQGALYTAVEDSGLASDSDEEMDGDCLLIDGISFGAMSE